MKLLAKIILFSLLAGIAWLTYASLRLAYWDNRVREICEREGGVQILEHISLTREVYESMPRVGGRVAGYAPQELTRPEIPTYGEFRQEVIRKDSPRVWKTFAIMVKKANGIPVARWLEVTRVGGDPITVDHPSSFTCPSPEEITEELSKVFVREAVK